MIQPDPGIFLISDAKLLSVVWGCSRQEQGNGSGDTTTAKQADTAQAAGQEELPAQFLGGWETRKEIGPQWRLGGKNCQQDSWLHFGVAITVERVYVQHIYRAERKFALKTWLRVLPSQQSSHRTPFPGRYFYLLMPLKNLHLPFGQQHLVTLLDSWAENRAVIILPSKTSQQLQAYNIRQQNSHLLNKLGCAFLFSGGWQLTALLQGEPQSFHIISKLQKKVSQLMMQHISRCEEVNFLPTSRQQVKHLQLLNWHRKHILGTVLVRDISYAFLVCLPTGQNAWPDCHCRMLRGRVIA